MKKLKGDFNLGPLKSRREAAAISFTLKLLDGKGRGVLDAYTPVFVDNTKLHNYSTQNAPKGKSRIAPGTNLSSLLIEVTWDAFIRFGRSYRMN